MYNIETYGNQQKAFPLKTCIYKKITLLQLQQQIKKLAERTMVEISKDDDPHDSDEEPGLIEEVGEEYGIKVTPELQLVVEYMKEKYGGENVTIVIEQVVMKDQNDCGGE